MIIKDNFNLFNLFLEKKVKIFVDKQEFSIHIPTIRELSTDDMINGVYHLWITPVDKLKEIIPKDFESSYDFVKIVLFELGIYKEFNKTMHNFISALEFFIPGIQIDFKNKKMIVDNINITQEIWDYIIYLLQLSCGEKIEKPHIFTSEDERKFYLAQKKMEDKIKKIKSQNADSEGLLKTFLTIQYKFNLSFDYLAEQTMAQIQWLQKYAAGAVSYEVNAQAFAAGNMKKGKKPDFFIK